MATAHDNNANCDGARELLCKPEHRALKPPRRFRRNGERRRAIACRAPPSAMPAEEMRHPESTPLKEDH